MVRIHIREISPCTGCALYTLVKAKRMYVKRIGNVGKGGAENGSGRMALNEGWRADGWMSRWLERLLSYWVVGLLMLGCWAVAEKSLGCWAVRLLLVGCCSGVVGLLGC